MAFDSSKTLEYKIGADPEYNLKDNEI